MNKSYTTPLSLIVAGALVLGGLGTCVNQNSANSAKQPTKVAAATSYQYISRDGKYKMIIPKGWVEIMDVSNKDRTSFVRVEDLRPGLNFPWPMIEVQRNATINHDNFKYIPAALEEAVKSNMFYRDFEPMGGVFSEGRYDSGFSSLDRKRAAFVRAIDNGQEAYLLFLNINNNARDVKELSEVAGSFQLVK